MANIARLGVILGLSSSEFVTGIDEAKRKTKELESTMGTLKVGAAAVGAAIAAATLQVMAFADEISDTADAYQTTIGNILDLSEALEMSGGKAELAGRMMGTFSNKVDEAANAGKQAQESFARIGISLKDLRDLSMDDLFKKALEQLSKIEDPVKRNAVAFDLFGKAVRGVDLTKLSQEMLTGAGATDKQKAAVAELANRYDQLHAAIFKAKLAFAEGIAPAFKTAEINFGGMGKALDEIVNVLKKAAEGFVFLAGTIIEVTKVGIKEMNDLGVAILAGLNPFDNKGFWDTLTARTAKSWGEFKQNMKGLASAGTEAVQAPATGGNAGREVKKAKDSQLDQLLKELATLDLIEAKYKASLDEQAKGVQLKTDMMYMTVNESQIAQRMYELDKKRAEQIGELEDKKRIALETGADKRVIQLLDEQMKKVNQTTDMYKQQISSLLSYQQQLEQSYMGGFLYSYKKYQELAINNALVIQQSVDALFQGMTDALTKFIMTGKFNFKDFATFVIAEIVRIQVAAAAAKMFSGLISIGLAAIGGLAGASGAATSETTALETGGVMSPEGGNFGTAGARAGGGDVNSGSSYLVGENGPEIFTPRNNGTIIPNNKMAGNNGMTVNQNFNIQAVDPASFNEKVMATIANNAKTVFSINKEGERQMGSVSFA